MIPPTIDCYPREELLPQLADLRAGQTVEITGVAEYNESPWDIVDIKYCVFTANVTQRGSSDLSDVLKIFKY